MREFSVVILMEIKIPEGLNLIYLCLADGVAQAVSCPLSVGPSHRVADLDLVRDPMGHVVKGASKTIGAPKPFVADCVIRIGHFGGQVAQAVHTIQLHVIDDALGEPIHHDELHAIGGAQPPAWYRNTASQ